LTGSAAYANNCGLVIGICSVPYNYQKRVKGEKRVLLEADGNKIKKTK